MQNKLLIILISVLFFKCSGYKYELIEDNNQYLLAGHFYNNNPFIKVKADPPNQFLVKKTGNEKTMHKDIRSIRRYGDKRNFDKIISGYIIDNGTNVELRLIMKYNDSDKTIEAYENGTYKLENRKTVENVCAHIPKKFKCGK